MKINLNSIDLEQFYVNEHILDGRIVYLVIPRQMGAKWNKDNLHFRSSIWDFEGNLISASFKKFFNFSEQLDISPIPVNLNGSSIVTKMDGSTLIISKYNGKFIIRTRGSIDVSAQPNADEIEILKQKYPKLFLLSPFEDTWNFSVILEWVTPRNQIVLKYLEVDFILIGLINHDDYSLWTQSALDKLAKDIEMPRPETYKFSTVEDLLENVDKWIDKEGIVLYCGNNQQQLIKIKAAKYLFLHRMKSELSSLEKIIDVWISQKYPSYNEFYSYILTTFDYELAEYCKGRISNICDAWVKVEQIEEGMTKFILSIKNLPTRKLQAERIISSYGGEFNNRAGMLFTLLDNKPLTSDMYKKLLFQMLKK